MFFEHHGKTIAQMLPSKESYLYPQTPGPAALDPVQAQRDYRITAFLNAKNFMGNVLTRVVLPNQPKGADERRTKEYFRQAAQPWGNTFMTTPTDAERLNNTQQQTFVKQRQLSPPSTYGQFYAFMHAMAAMFGNLNSNT